MLPESDKVAQKGIFPLLIAIYPLKMRKTYDKCYYSLNVQLAGFFVTI